MNSTRGILLGIFVFIGFVGSAQLSMLKTNDGILITEEGKEVLLYRNASRIDGNKCERCNYIHPLYGLNGGILSEDAPADHPHQRGIFWAWHQVFVDGKQVGDQWLLENMKNEIVEFEFMKQRGGNVIMQTEVDWYSNKFKINGIEKPFIKEFGRIEVYPVSGNFRRIDFEIQLRALVDHVQIGGSNDEKGYGGFSIRMKLPDKVSFIGPDGALTPENEAIESNGFVNISGKIEKGVKNGGIVIIDHPDNPCYPQNWILREKNSMQNSVWPGKELIDLKLAEPVTLKYTLLVYTGKINAKRIERIIETRIADPSVN